MLFRNAFTRTLLVAAFGIGFTAATAQADNAPVAADKSSQQLFESLDANKDGELTAEEAGEKHRRLFDRLLRKAGKESDGRLTAAEFTAALAPNSLPTTPLTGQISERANNVVPDPAAVFARLDANQDGMLTREELDGPYAERLKGMLERLGKDGITKDEFLKSAEQMRKRMEAGGGGLAAAIGNPEMMFSRLDTNGDGSLSRDEIPEPARERLGKLFDRLKTDSISKDQFLEHSKRFAILRGSDGKSVPGQGKKPGKPGVGKPGVGSNESDMKTTDEPTIAPETPASESAKVAGNAKVAGKGRPAAGMLKKLDKDGDGKVSKSEAPERLARRFDRIDANKDGYLDASELQAAMSKLGELRTPGNKTPGKESRKPGKDGESGRTSPQRPAADDADA